MNEIPLKAKVIIEVRKKGELIYRDEKEVDLSKQLCGEE